MKKPFLILLTGLLILSSCKTAKKTEAAPTPVDPIMDEAFRKPINDKELFTMIRETIPLDTAYIAGDTLHMITKKVQACQTDKFNLVWNGMMLKSLPQQASVRLLLVAEPSCREQHSFHLLYNVSPLHLKQDSVGVGRTTIIRIGNWKHTIRYAP